MSSGDFLIRGKYDFFFDSAKVINHVERKRTQVLSRTGAYGQAVMRNSFKRGKDRSRNSATPNKPPRHWQSGKQGGLRRVLFSYNPFAGSVVIGPMRFPLPVMPRRFVHGKRSFMRPIGMTVPQILNVSGAANETTQWLSGTTIKRRVRVRQFNFTELALIRTYDKMRYFLASVPF